MALRLLLGFFLVIALGLAIALQVFIEEVKPGTRLAMEDSLVDTAQALALLAAPDVLAGHAADGPFAQAMRTYPSIDPAAQLWEFRKSTVDLRVTLTDASGQVLFSNDGTPVGSDSGRWNDIARTLAGRYGARSSVDGSGDPDRTVMHVAAPVRAPDGNLIGVLSVSRPNRSLEPYIDRSRDRILRWTWGLLAASLVIGALFSWWLARSVSRLRHYAHAVAQGERAELPTLGRWSGRTELTDLAQAVEQMRLRLEDKAYVERYVHALTHELKSPLAAIQGAAELLQEPLPASDQHRFATSILRQSGRLQDLVERLLRLAQLEQMHHLDDVETLDLVAMTQSVLQGLGARLAHQSLQVTLSHPSSVTLQGQRFLLSQAIENLLDNAIAFAPAGSTLRIEIHECLWQGLPGVHWQLMDDGPGFPAFAANRLFDRFFSLPRGPLQQRSTGLGLCLVQEVAALHHGRARVVNRADGPGCEASLTLPSLLPDSTSHPFHTGRAPTSPR